MKIFLIAAMICIFSGFECFAFNRSAVNLPDSILINNKDSTEYEIIILDPEFDGWMTKNALPLNYYSSTYYRNKNILYVHQWNTLVLQNTHKEPFDWTIPYDDKIIYGVGVDFKLYYYFQFLKSKYPDKIQF